jgi:GNAT superfamily N-acetyltransferase
MTTMRTARLNEREELRSIERAAGKLFADAGMVDVANHEPESVEGLAAYISAGRAWVIADDATPIGYALVDVVDELAHLEQISVRPEYGGRGYGAALLEHVCDWARQQGFAAITLTTFSDLPWNGPFYAKHGFVALDPSFLGPELRALRNTETAHGLDPDRRVCMRREL